MRTMSRKSRIRGGSSFRLKNEVYMSYPPQPFYGPFTVYIMSYVRSYLIHGCETQPVKVEPEVKLGRTEMHLVGWMDAMWVYCEEKEKHTAPRIVGIETSCTGD